MWNVLWMSCLSGLSTPLGAYLVIRYYKSLVRVQGLFWGIAAGIMSTLVIVELMPTSISIGGNRVFFLTAGLGCGTMYILQRIISSGNTTSAIQQPESNFLYMGWFVALAIALHDLPEGIAIAAGNAMHHEMGVLIAVAIAVHNVPEGMSVAFPLAMAGVNRRKILTLSMWIGMVTPLGTFLSLWFVAVSNTFIAISLALASGTMLFVVCQDIFPEALRLSKRLAFGGFAIGGLVMLWLTSLHV